MNKSYKKYFTISKIISFIFGPIFALNKYPVFYKGEKFYLVGFGFFSAATAFIAMSFFVIYLQSKNIHLFYPLALWLPMGAFCTIFFSKIFHIGVVGKKFFSAPLKYFRQTAFYNQGGQIGVFVTAILISYFENISPWVIMDALCFGYCAALIIGRLGCYNYGCCHGKSTKNQIFSVIYNNKYSKVLRVHPELKGKALIPTQLISALFNLLLFIFLLIIYFFESKDGILALFFFALYNSFRLMIHGFRANDSSAKKKQDDKIFLKTSIIFTCMGILALISAWIFYDSLPQHSIFQPISWQLYFNSLAYDPVYLATLLTVTLICIFVYGYHWHRLGQHL